MTTVAEYLAVRLRQLGVEHLFGVPGDFSLALVEALGAPGRLEWVGTANELDAGYAADGYARRRGLGALCTTFGVGELSALNAVAGAAAEAVPVVQITGSPATTAAGSGVLLHHTLADGDHGRTLRAYREFTAAAELLTADPAAEQIDHVLATALRRLRPVYLSVPADLVEAPLDDADRRRLERPIALPGSDAGALARFTAAVHDLLAAGDGHRPVLLVGHLVQRLAAGNRLGAVARAGGWPVVHLLTGRATLDEDRPPVAGWYAGAMGPAGVRTLVDEARPLITVGATFTDVVSGLGTHRHDAARGVTLDLDGATVAGRRFDGVRLVDALDALAPLAAAFPAELSDATLGAGTPVGSGRPVGPGGGDNGLSQEQLWQALQDWLPPHTTLVTDIGTAFWGAAGLTLPAGAAFVAQPVWSSIGYALPATLGVALAEPGRRAVLVTGDGAAQMTAAELGLLARRAPGALVIVIDNAGYTIERALRSPRAAHHDVPRWDWTALAAALAPDHPPLGLAVRTAGDLAEALKHADAEPGRLTVLHVTTHPMDAPPLLRALAEAVTRS